MGLGEDGVGEGFEGGEVGGLHPAADRDHLLDELDVLHVADHLFHHAAGRRGPGTILYQSDATIGVVLDLEPVKELIHRRKQTCIIG